MRERFRFMGMSLGLILSGVAVAQDAQSGPSDVYNSAPAKPNAAPVQNLSKEQIAQLVAPLALYPDSLLTQVLMASTYPLEVVQADRFAKANKDLKGDDLAKQLEKQPWDPSVKSLVNFPQVLAMMSDQLDTTVQIGNAFLAQQQDVLAAVQDLRSRAEQAGTLKSNDQVNVTSQPADAGAAVDGNGVPDNFSGISIAPTADNLSYIPAYDPTTIYGAWPYPNYQPYSYYPAGYGGGGLAWGSGITYGYPWGYAWGSPNWHRRWIDYDFHRNERWNHSINRDQYHDQWERYRASRNFGDDHWTHDAGHRYGVPYPDARDAELFRERAARDERNRDVFRGRDYGDNDSNFGTRNDNRGNDSSRDSDRNVIIRRGGAPAGNAASPDRNTNRPDVTANDRSVIIRRDRQTTIDRRQAESDANRRSPRNDDPQPVDRSDLGDVNRTQTQERAAADRGRISRGPAIAPRPQQPVESPAIRSSPAPVRDVPAASPPAPVRIAPTATPSSPRISSPPSVPAPRAVAPASPSGNARGGGEGNGRR